MCVPSRKSRLRQGGAPRIFPFLSVCCCSLCTNALRGPAAADFWERNRRLALNRRSFRVTCLFRPVRVLRSFPRGLSGRSFDVVSFPTCDRASTRPFVDARGPSMTSRRRDSPDTDKIFRSSCGTPRRSNREHAWPIGQVEGTHRAGREPQGFARPKAANRHRHKSRIRFLHSLVCDATLQ